MRDEETNKVCSIGKGDHFFPVFQCSPRTSHYLIWKRLFFMERKRKEIKVQIPPKKCNSHPKHSKEVMEYYHLLVLVEFTSCLMILYDCAYTIPVILVDMYTYIYELNY